MSIVFRSDNNPLKQTSTIAFWSTLSSEMLKEGLGSSSRFQNALGVAFVSCCCSLKDFLYSGFKEVREEQKSQMVGHVFDSVALKYDLMNDIMSAGLHRLWKDRLVSKLNSFPGMKHIDMAGGTGDVAFRILDTIKRNKSGPMHYHHDDLQEQTQIYVCDINPNMLNVGKKRAMERGLGEDKSLLWLEEDAEALHFGDNSMDGYTIAFGIRDVTHMEKALAEAYRYDFCSFTVIPAVGKLVTGDRDSYQYLIESIRRFPPQETFVSMIAEAGFKKVEYENILGGVVAIHSGLKL
ncbi:hypothetical protein CRYUN_Cryun02cG0143300 [Craigia yunnanensis]